MSEETKIIAYEGFDKNMKCRGIQYEAGKECECGGHIKACKNGFHACENALDVFGYYPPSDSRYCEVEQSGDTDRDSHDSKIASGNMRITLGRYTLDSYRDTVDEGIAAMIAIAYGLGNIVDDHRAQEAETVKE